MGIGFVSTLLHLPTEIPLCVFASQAHGQLDFSVGYDQALAAFRETYALLEGQTNQVIERRTRVLSPDVVLVSAISEGTYTDKAGFTSAPVGLGSTIVFVRRHGEWRVIHFHQSVAK